MYKLITFSSTSEIDFLLKLTTELEYINENKYTLVSCSTFKDEEKKVYTAHIAIKC